MCGEGGDKGQGGEGEGQRVNGEKGRDKRSKKRGIKSQNAMCASIKGCSKKYS